MYTEDAVKHGATHYLPMKNGVTPQLFYKQNEAGKLEYISFRGIWMGSTSNNRPARFEELFNQLIEI